jgi:hypothetical protein
MFNKKSSLLTGCPLIKTSSKHAFCGPARDTNLTNRQTGKLNFDTYYITMVDIIQYKNMVNYLLVSDRNKQENTENG